MSAARAATVLAYHARSKHALNGYAAGPGTLDWDTQPAAFRDWAGTSQIPLPREISVADITWNALPAARAPMQFNAANLGSLLRLCVGLTAWKEHAGERWSLRAHPSSGNLHPTETWLITSGVTGLADGLYHYHNLHHALERRAWEGSMGNGVWLGFSSIHWREAWKYGERAFRYCQLDMGHVLAAVSYAAALHGWQPRLLSRDSAAVAHDLGLDRADDFAGVEAEEAEVIVALQADPASLSEPHWHQWAGKPSLLDPRPLYQWPVIEEIAEATRGALPATTAAPVPAAITNDDGADICAAQVILKRRSAQAFDGQSVLPHAVLHRILAALLPGGGPVWKLWTPPARVHPVLLVHRVEGIAPGVYVMPRTDAARDSLQTAFRTSFSWQTADTELPLFQLVAARAGKTARTLSCHQDIATQSALTFLMVAEFAAPVAADPAAYRHLHWEAGMLGHIITLQAEAAGWRSTGIGCFFDDAVHEVLGIKSEAFQVIYHYAVGMALDDPRIATSPAYP